MSTPHLGGASISARTRTPSVDLAYLAELLATALDPARTQSSALFIAGANRLDVNVGRALRLLFKEPGFTDDLSFGDDKGFIRDLEIPPRGTSAPWDVS